MHKVVPLRNKKTTNYNHDSYDNLISNMQNMHNHFHSLFDSFFDDNFHSIRFNKLNSFSSNYNIKELSENRYLININVAGFQKNEIEIVLESDCLIIKGKSLDTKKDQYIHQGFVTQFTNKFSIGESSEILDASMINGILSITIKENLPTQKATKRIFIR